MRTIVILTFLTLTFTGCQMIMKKIYGIKDPDIENRKSIVKKANKFGLDTADIVTVNGKDFLYVMKERSIPDAAIYDKNGKYIEYRQTDTSCNAGLFQFIPDLSLTGKYNQPDHSTLEEELKKYRSLSGDMLTPYKPADFYILIYWTVWTGKLNKDHVNVWEDLANRNKNCKIKVIKVNLDIQEYWSKDDRDKVIAAMSKKK